MKNYSFSLLGALLIVVSCTTYEDLKPIPLEGNPGNPRFNLIFDNSVGVDLDLYVMDPQGEIVYYGNRISASGGTLDVDCLCGGCPNGGNENIYWPTDGSAPTGTYTFWVDYYSGCSQSPTSSFTLRVINNERIIDTYTGQLRSGISTRWTYVHR